MDGSDGLDRADWVHRCDRVHGSNWRNRSDWLYGCSEHGHWSYGVDGDDWNDGCDGV